MTESEETKRLVAVLKAECDGDSLKYDEATNRVHVCARTEDGVLRTLGHVDKGMLIEDPVGFWKCVERIKFRI